MKIKTEDLDGIHLDVAVAIALGGKVTRPQDGQVYLDGMHQLCGEKNKRHSRYVYSPSSDWSQCGELMENLAISCYQSVDPVSGEVFHWVGVNELVTRHRRGLIADNPRVAICRAVVFAKLGHEVDIPDELAGKEPS